MAAIELQYRYPHPPERVWRALTEPKWMSRWLMQVHGFEARVGCLFQFRAPPEQAWNGVVDCEVVECSPPRVLAYTWVGQNRHEGYNEYSRTTVRWTLTAVANGTALTFVQSGFTGVRGNMLAFALKMGWRIFLHSRIGKVLEVIGGQMS